MRLRAMDSAIKVIYSVIRPTLLTCTYIHKKYVCRVQQLHGTGEEMSKHGYFFFFFFLQDGSPHEGERERKRRGGGGLLSRALCLGKKIK